MTINRPCNLLLCVMLESICSQQEISTELSGYTMIQLRQHTSSNCPVRQRVRRKQPYETSFILNPFLSINL